MSTQEINDDTIVEKAVQLSLVEVVLGSVLHGMKVPLTGHFLSLNQGVFLTRFLEGEHTRTRAFKTVTEISVVTAVMKALSPAGKKLGPMISISTQGFLYGVGIFIGGTNILGKIMGMMLLSLWAFIQPLVTWFLMYGSDLMAAMDYYISKLDKHVPVSKESLLVVLVTLVGLKLLIAALLPFLYKRITIRLLHRLPDGLSRSQKDELSTTKGMLRDLTRPIFIVSLMVMAAFFYLSGEDSAVIFWKIMRAFAVAFVIFFMARSRWVRKHLAALASRHPALERIGNLSSRAMKRMEEIS